MDINLIYGGSATLEDMYILYGLGFTFEVNNGRVTAIIG